MHPKIRLRIDDLSYALLFILFSSVLSLGAATSLQYDDIESFLEPSNSTSNQRDSEFSPRGQEMEESDRSLIIMFGALCCIVILLLGLIIYFVICAKSNPDDGANMQEEDRSVTVKNLKSIRSGVNVPADVTAGSSSEINKPDSFRTRVLRALKLEQTEIGIKTTQGAQVENSISKTLHPENNYNPNTETKVITEEARKISGTSESEAKKSLDRIRMETGLKATNITGGTTKPSDDGSESMTLSRIANA